MEPMNSENLKPIDLLRESDPNVPYTNIPVAIVNDHVVRLSIMTEPFYWHLHPDSDESFLVLEGSLFIDLEDKTIELFPNQLFTIPKNVKHRTRPNGSRSVNLTLESAGMTTVRLEG